MLASASSPQRRMFYNDDGDTCLTSYRGPMRGQIATDAAEVLAGTPVTTLCYCVTPSDCTNYPSQVASMAAWRKTPSHETSPHFRWQYEFYTRVRELGWDIPTMVMQRCAQLGIEFIPSMRMSDGHFAQKVHPTVHPWTSKFWMEHQHLSIGPANFPLWGNEHLLDFRHAEVQQWKLAHLREIIARYGQQGFEMDWTRHYTYFKPGQEQPEVLTMLVRCARQALDQIGGARRLPLIVRVAATVDLSRSCGFDIATWIKEGLIDYLVPSDPSRYMGLDIPIQPWLDLVAGSGVEVHPSPESAAHWGDGRATVEMYRAAASNYFAMGAHGIYMFNLFCRGYPLRDDAYVILRDLSTPAALDRRDKHFIVMPPPNQWRNDTAALPIALDQAGAEVHLSLFVGDDLDSTLRDRTLRQAQMRLRLDQWPAHAQLFLAINGVSIDPADVRPIEPAFSRPATWTWEQHTLDGSPGVWFAVDLHRHLPRLGENDITVRIASTDRPVRLVGLDLRVMYDFCGQNEDHKEAI